MTFDRRCEYSYGNTEYVLLAIIIERVSGEPLDTLSNDRRVEPLDLVHTRWRIGVKLSEFRDRRLRRYAG
ncbi:MAG: serine hydrolase [Steroidobacteraceae bacterium]